MALPTRIPPHMSSLVQREHCCAHMMPLNVQLDGVLASATQDEVYEQVVAPLTATALSGQPAALLCCGARGSGKTYTSCGPSTGRSSNRGAQLGAAAVFAERGMAPRAAAAAAAAVAAADSAGGNVQLSVSALEVHNDRLVD